MEESRLVLERMRSDDSSNPVLVEATENYIKFVMEEIVGESVCICGERVCKLLTGMWADPDMKSYVPRSDIPIIRFETAEDCKSSLSFLLQRSVEPLEVMGGIDIAYVRDHRKMRRDLNRKWERQYADGDFGAAVPVPVAL